MTAKVLVNASNLHTGGGVQVATSFICELSLMADSARKINIIASDEVHEALSSMGCDCTQFAGYEIFNTYGLSALWSGIDKVIRRYDLVFTVFGPLYILKCDAISITGFAQAWIINTRNEAYFSASLFERLKIRLRYFFQSLFFFRADKLIVELEHVRAGLVSAGLADASQVEVVHNCLSSLYVQPEKWMDLAVDPSRKNYSIGFIGRDYPHKNTNILPLVKAILLEKHGLAVDFYVTMSDDEWRLKSPGFRESIMNVGVLAISQCPSFYQKMDAVIFPSLLECFSATPLEAMVMKKPLFASNRGFVRDVCADFAFYFDPVNPESAAAVIASYIVNYASSDQARLGQARDHALAYSNARDRAGKYINIIEETLARQGC